MRQCLLALFAIDLHQLAVARAGPLGQRQVDGAAHLGRHADHDCPVKLLGLAVAKGLTQALGRLPRPCDQQQPDVSLSRR